MSPHFSWIYSNGLIASKFCDVRLQKSNLSLNSIPNLSCHKILCIHVKLKGTVLNSRGLTVLVICVMFLPCYAWSISVCENGANCAIHNKAHCKLTMDIRLYVCLNIDQGMKSRMKMHCALSYMCLGLLLSTSYSMFQAFTFRHNICANGSLFYHHTRHTILSTSSNANHFINKDDFQISPRNLHV